MTLIKKSRLLTLTTLLLFTYTLNAQNCKFDEEKKDPFSNELIRKTAHKIGPATWNWMMTFTQTGNNLGMDLRVVLGGHLQETITKGNILFLKLENGEVLQLLSLEDATPAHLVATGTIWTNYFFKYQLNNDVKAKMAQSPITDLKIKIGANETLLPKITEKQTSRIMNTVSCMSK
jgi:hypothetical protein